MSFFGSLGCKGNACSAFNSADPEKDTVKFTAVDKENAPPPEDAERAAAAAKEARERERAEAEAKHQRELEEKRKRDEERKRQLEMEERMQREREAEERAREEEAYRIQEEERRRQAQEAEEQRMRKEEEEKREREAREQREAQEAAEKKQKVDEFLASHGYSDVNAKRKSKFGRYKYPLHTAVKRNPEIVPILIDAGANPANKNSAGLTAYEYAKKLKSSSEEHLHESNA